MKADVLNFITAKSSKNFENKISKLLPEGVTEIYLSSCGMQRKGTGSYNYFLDVVINRNEYMTFTSHTHSSPTWDEYTDFEDRSRKLDNFNKNVALMLIEENIDTILDMLNEQEND